MKIGSLFSGYGGLDIAVRGIITEAFGLESEFEWHCEFDRAPSRILAHHYPEVPNLGDITMVDWSSVAPIDVLTGGFPCQDVSAAGRRAGLVNGTRTGLFHEVVKAIDALRPRYVVLENVLGIFSADGDEWPDSVKELHAAAEKWGRVVRLIDAKTDRSWKKGRVTNEWTHRKAAERVRASRQHKRCLAEFRRERYRLVPRAFATVLRCLAEVGYDARWTCLRASDVGAPHHRGRVFILATPADTDRVGRGQGAEQPGAGAAQESAPVGDLGSLPRDGRADDLLTCWASDRPVSARCGAPTRADVFAGIYCQCERAEVPVLPTPAACNPNDGEGPETWLRRRDEVKARVGNGNGMGTPLAIAVQLLGDEPRLPTPTATSDGSAASPEKREARVAKAKAKHGRGFGKSLDVAVAELEVVLPTPTVGNATGTNERRGGKRSGELLLPGVAAAHAAGEFLPTPRAMEAEQTMGSPGAARHVAAGNGGLTETIGVVFPTPTTSEATGGKGPDSKRSGGEYLREVVTGVLPSPTASDASGGGLHPDHPGRQGHTMQLPDYVLLADEPDRWGKYAPAIRRWEAVLGRPAPAPTEPNANGRPRLNARFAEWMMGLPEGWVTGVEIGISRAEQLKAIGNGVCPQQAATALWGLIEMPMEVAS